MLALQPVISKVWRDGMPGRLYLCMPHCPVLCTRTVADATESSKEAVHPPLHHRTWQGKEWLRGLLVAHDSSSLHAISLCSAQGGCGRRALLIPSLLASKDQIGSNPLDNGYPLLVLEAAAPSPWRSAQP
jgi:hypothetical protein